MPHLRAAAVLLAASATAACAGTLTPNTGAPQLATPASPSTQAFQAADARMMAKMGAPMTGDPDRDFVAKMLPHHSGAVDMAKVELQYGKDPDMRRLAAAIVRAQEQEIVELNAWRAKHP